MSNRIAIVYFTCGILALMGLMTSNLSANDNMTADPAWCAYPAGNGPGGGKHVILIAGDDEYRSEEALPMLGKILAKHHGFRCTVLFPINDEGFIQPDHQEKIPGLHLLKSADLVVLGLRFRNLPDKDMKHFDEYVESGKPIIGLRTSTHAFNIPRDRIYARYGFNAKDAGWKGGFGRRVLGDTWINHHGHHGRESTRGIVNANHAQHPILKGIDDVWGPTDVYGIKHLSDEAQVLLHGQVVAGMRPTDKAIDSEKNEPMMPLAWINDYKTTGGQTAKVFCTTMGAATDFESADLRRLIVNATYWGLDLEDKITADCNVDFVDTFKPSKFGFGTYRKGLKPADFDLKNK